MRIFFLTHALFLEGPEDGLIKHTVILSRAPMIYQYKPRIRYIRLTLVNLLAKIPGMKSIGSDSPVKRSEFLKETQSLRQGINTLDQKVNTLALELVRTNVRLEKVDYALETRVATKDDIGKVLDAIDQFSHRIETYDRKALVHDRRFTDNDAALNDHE